MLNDIVVAHLVVYVGVVGIVAAHLVVHDIVVGIEVAHFVVQGGVAGIVAAHQLVHGDVVGIYIGCSVLTLYSMVWLRLLKSSPRERRVLSPSSSRPSL